MDLERRKRQHFRVLRKGKHWSSSLQSEYDKYGKEAFNFKILALCELEDLIRFEQNLLNCFKPAYNLSPTAGSPLGIIRSIEARQKMSDAKTGIIPWNKGIPHSEATRKKIGDANRGRHFSEAVRRKMSESRTGEKNHMFGRSGKRASFFGKHHSEATLQLMRETHKRENLSDMTRKLLSEKAFEREARKRSTRGAA